MKLFDILKQFKTIEPDAEFTQRSRTEILLSPQSKQRSIRGVFAFLHVLETGAALVLAGFFVLILTGSFSGTRSVSPIQYAVIDPSGLHAEADAIDMQIQLANINYPQVTSTSETSSIIMPAVTKAAFLHTALMKISTTSSTATSSAINSGASTTSATSTASSSISIDQALQKLSQ